MYTEGGGDKSVPFLKYVSLLIKMQQNTKKVYPPSKIFTTLIPIPSLPKFGRNLMEPPPEF
jgi:hypothetical protein